MKFTITESPRRNPPIEYYTQTGKLVQVVEGDNGTDYPDINAFCAANNLVPPAVYTARQNAKVAAQTAYRNALNAGYHDATLDVIIGITKADQDNWVAVMTALTNAEKVLSTDISEQPVSAIVGSIYGRDGTPLPVTLTVLQFRALLLAGTQAVGILRAKLAADMAEADALTSA